MDADRRNRVEAFLASSDNELAPLCRELLAEVNVVPYPDLSSQVAALEADRDDLTRELGRVQGAYEGVLPSLEQAHKDDIARLAEIDRLRGLNDSLSATVSPLREHVAELAQKVLDRDRTVATLSETLTDLRRENARLAGELSEFKPPRSLRPKG